MAEAKTTTTTTTVTPDTEVNEVLDKAKGFWDKFSKPITYVGGAIILLIGGWYGYRNFIKLPNEQKANDALYAAESIVDKMATTSFSKDSVTIALSGGALEGRKVTGLLNVISSYSGTPAANRAKYLAGAVYLQTKEFDKAIKYLKDFDANGATQVQMKAYQMIGDAYAELKKNDDAFEYYKKATTVNTKDESFTADALMRAASFAKVINKNKEAIELLKKLKDNYPTNSSVTTGEVDKQLASMGEVSGDN
ncbi:MAG: tetratricopeptide repeat protein [Bacteroidetes bacterium]|nr:tetratricopeptide repeat protein [Bacteroidota bacterium]